MDEAEEVTSRDSVGVSDAGKLKEEMEQCKVRHTHTQTHTHTHLHKNPYRHTSTHTQRNV